MPSNSPPSPLSKKSNLGGFVLEFVITRLLSINPDGLRLIVKLLRLKHTMSGDQGFTDGVLGWDVLYCYLLATAHVRSFCSRPM